MRQILIVAATVATLAGSMGAAEAFPLAPVGEVVVVPEVTLVSGGCGPYAHRNPFGACRPNFGGPRFFGRPYGFYGYHRPFRPHYGFYRRY